MVRFLLALLTLAAAVSAQATRPAPSAPATPARALSAAEREELHFQAVALMRDEDYQKAYDVLERVYNATPPSQRSRSLILNHVNLDLIQKKFVMRGVKDVSEYLTRHRAEDEFATNVLGAALNAAAMEPKLKKSPLWVAAWKEWDRRNYLLDHSRPGWHRWGTRWVTEEEHKAREAKREDLRQAIAVQGERVNRYALSVDSLLIQQQNAISKQADYAYLRQFLTQVQANPTANWYDKQSAQQSAGKSLEGEADAWLSAREISGDLALALKQMTFEQNELRKLKSELESIRPEWPTRFPPVDPNAPVPATPATYPAGTTPPTTPSTQSAPAARKPFGPADLYGGAKPTTAPVPSTP